MTLYLIKEKNSRTCIKNLYGLVFNEIKGNSGTAVGVVAYFRKKDAINYMKELSKSANYKFEYEIITITVKEV